NKQIARYAASVFGGVPRVDEYVNDSDTLSVGILSCPDRPMKDVTSYSTIKLSDHPMPWIEGEFPARLELAGVCSSDVEKFSNILASAAFTIIGTGAVYHPGTVIHDIVRSHLPRTHLPHLYLTMPFMWGKKLNELDCGNKRVVWLLAMPIGETEYEYLKNNGEEDFEKLLSSRHADFSNLERALLA